MDLDYTIHWIDDTREWVDSVYEEIKTIMESLPLTPKVTFKENGDDIELLIKTESIDLLIVDYKLPNKNGDEIIKFVREYGELTEIIFYSQDNTHQSLLSGWAGVHCIPREDAEKEIIKVIEGFIARSQNLAVMRGVIIAEAIDVENKLTEIIKKIFDNKADLFQAKILDKALLDFEKKRMIVQSCLNDKIEEEKSAVPQNLEYKEKLQKLSSGLNEFKKEIIDQRNILAHSEKSFDSQGCLTLKPLNKSSSKITFNNDWINKVRSNIKKHRTNLDDLFNLF